MTQAAIAELYQTTPQNITIHLKALYGEGELEEAATCKEYLQVQQEGSRRISRGRKFYSLPAIIAVGYRVRSLRGIQFRRWATERLNEYLVKGFTMDDDRLKAGVHIGSDYFDEMLERISLAQKTGLDQVDTFTCGHTGNFPKPSGGMGAAERN